MIDWLRQLSNYLYVNTDDTSWGAPGSGRWNGLTVGQSVGRGWLADERKRSSLLIRFGLRWLQKLPRTVQCTAGSHDTSLDNVRSTSKQVNDNRRVAADTVNSPTRQLAQSDRKLSCLVSTSRARRTRAADVVGKERGLSEDWHRCRVTVIGLGRGFRVSVSYRCWHVPEGVTGCRQQMCATWLDSSSTSLHFRSFLFDRVTWLGAWRHTWRQSWPRDHVGRGRGGRNGGRVSPSHSVPAQVQNQPSASTSTSRQLTHPLRRLQSREQLYVILSFIVLIYCSSALYCMSALFKTTKKTQQLLRRPL